MLVATTAGGGQGALLWVPPPARSGRPSRRANAALHTRLQGTSAPRLGAQLLSRQPNASIGRGLSPPLLYKEEARRRSPGQTRASNKPDVPTFKGYPPMQTKPAWYWRLLACIPYLMPLCESWMYAETAYNLHCFIEQFEFWTYPFLNLLGRLPSWFLLAYFFVAYLGIVRKNIWPHFFRFHVVTGMLLEIILQVFGTLNDWIPQSVYWGRLGAHFWLAAFFTYLLTTLESIRCALRGMYADIPFISDAAYMQIPYD